MRSTKKGPKWNDGPRLFVVALILIIVMFCLTTERTVGAFDKVEQGPVELSAWERVYYKYYNGYPEGVSERRDYIVEYMAINTDLSNEEINNLVNIANKESSAHDPEIVPQTWVKHCQRPNGTYYAVEFGECSYREVHREKSIGIFQILPSTAKRQCGMTDITRVDSQIDCAVMIYKQSGYGAWYNSSVKLGIL
jgi:hypothetical protein